MGFNPVDLAFGNMDAIKASNKRLKADNAKLRELASGIGHLLFSLDVDYCAACPRDGINHSCPVFTVDGGECLYKTDLRELGMEVGEWATQTRHKSDEMSLRTLMKSSSTSSTQTC